MSLPSRIDALSNVLAIKTKGFVSTRHGKIFLALVMLGPITFLPTVYQAWTAENIDSLRTSTWPLMVVVNCSATLGVIHNGDWRMRLVMVIWIVMMLALWIATIVR